MFKHKGLSWTDQNSFKNSDKYYIVILSLCQETFFFPRWHSGAFHTVVIQSLPSPPHLLHMLEYYTLGWLRKKTVPKTAEFKCEFLPNQGTNLICIIHILKLKASLELLKFAITSNRLAQSRGRNDSGPWTYPTCGSRALLLVSACQWWNATRHFFFRLVCSRKQ